MKYPLLRTLFICLFFGPVVLLAQQDAMFTKYMFNTLVYNPAYAGSHDHLSINALHRGQWWGIDGAPTTQTLSVHSPVSDRVGIGLSLINDKIGPTGSTQVNAIYAYRIPLGAGKLSIGLQAGVFQWRADWSQLNLIRKVRIPLIERCNLPAGCPISEPESIISHRSFLLGSVHRIW